MTHQPYSPDTQKLFKYVEQLNQNDRDIDKKEFFKLETNEVLLSG